MQVYSEEDFNQGDLSPWLKTSSDESPSSDVTVRAISILIRSLPVSARGQLQNVLHAYADSPPLEGVPQPFALLQDSIPDKMLFPIVVGAMHHIATELLQNSGNASLTGNIPLDYAFAPSLIPVTGQSSTDQEGDLPFTGLVPLLLMSAMGKSGSKPGGIAMPSAITNLIKPHKEALDAKAKHLSSSATSRVPQLRSTTVSKTKDRPAKDRTTLPPSSTKVGSTKALGASPYPSTKSGVSDSIGQKINKAAFGSAKIFTGDPDTLFYAVSSLPRVAPTDEVASLIDQAKAKFGYDAFTAALSRSIKSRAGTVGYEMGDIITDGSSSYAHDGDLKGTAVKEGLEFINKMKQAAKDKMPKTEFLKDIRQGLGFGVGAETASRVADRIMDGAPQDGLKAVADAGNPQGSIQGEVYNALKFNNLATQPSDTYGSPSGGSPSPGTVGTRYAAFKGHSIHLNNLFDLGVNLLQNRDRAFLLMNRSASNPTAQAAAYALSGDIIIRDSLPEVVEFILSDRDSIQPSAIHSLPEQFVEQDTLSPADTLSALTNQDDPAAMAYTTNQALPDAPDGRGIRLRVSDGESANKGIGAALRSIPSGSSRTRKKDIRDFARGLRGGRRTMGDLDESDMEGDFRSDIPTRHSDAPKSQAPATSKKPPAKKPASAFSYTKGLIGSRHGDSVITTMRKMMATANGKQSNFARTHVGKDQSGVGARVPMNPPTSNTAFISRAYELRKTDKNQGDKVLANMVELGLINKNTFKTITAIDYDKMTSELGLPSTWPTDPSPKIYTPESGPDPSIRPLLQDYIASGPDAAFPERDSKEQSAPGAEAGTVGPPKASPAETSSTTVQDQAPIETTAGKSYLPGMEFVAVVPLSGEIPPYLKGTVSLVADGKSHPLMLVQDASGDISLKSMGDIIEED